MEETCACCKNGTCLHTCTVCEANFCCNSCLTSHSYPPNPSKDEVALFLDTEHLRDTLSAFRDQFQIEWEDINEKFQPSFLEAWFDDSELRKKFTKRREEWFSIRALPRVDEWKSHDIFSFISKFQWNSEIVNLESIEKKLESLSGFDLFYSSSSTGNPQWNEIVQILSAQNSEFQSELNKHLDQFDPEQKRSDETDEEYETKQKESSIRSRIIYIPDPLIDKCARNWNQPCLDEKTANRKSLCEDRTQSIIIGVAGEMGLGKSFLINELLDFESRKKRRGPIIAKPSSSTSTTSDVHLYWTRINDVPIRIFDLEGARGGNPSEKRLRYQKNDSQQDDSLLKWKKNRKIAIERFLPSLCYLSCSILLYVDKQSGAHDSWMENIVNFCKNCSNNTGGPLPVLILLKNRANEFDENPDIDADYLCNVELQTENFRIQLEEKLAYNGHSEKILEKFKQIHYILLPHRHAHRELFLKQRQKLIDLISHYTSEYMKRDGVMNSVSFSYKVIASLCKQWDPERAEDNFLDLANAVVVSHVGKELGETSREIFVRMLSRPFSGTTPFFNCPPLKENAVKLRSIAEEQWNLWRRFLDLAILVIVYFEMVENQELTLIEFSGLPICTHISFARYLLSLSKEDGLQPCLNIHVSEDGVEIPCTATKGRLHDDNKHFFNIPGHSIHWDVKNARETKPVQYDDCKDIFQKYFELLRGKSKKEMKLEFAKIFFQSEEVKHIPNDLCLYCLKEDLFPKPNQILICGHQYCSECVNDLKDENMLYCPICGEEKKIIDYSGRVLEGCGIRVLSIDGGGVRGLVSFRILDKLSFHLKKYNLELKDVFDLVAGTSFGSVVATLLTLKLKQDPPSFDDMKTLFSKMFNSKKSMLETDSLENLLKSNHSKYEFTELDKILGCLENPSICEQYSDGYDGPRIMYLASEMEPDHRFKSCQKRTSQTILSNIPTNNRYPREYDYLTWGTFEFRSNVSDLVKASCAAPLYFPPQDMGARFLAKGGEYPSRLAQAMAESLWIDRQISIFVSIGTGLSKQKGTDVELPNHLSASSKLNYDLRAQQDWWEGKKERGEFHRWDPGEMELKFDETSPSQIEKMILRTDEYLVEIDEQIAKTAKNLVGSMFYVEMIHHDPSKHEKVYRIKLRSCSDKFEYSPKNFHCTAKFPRTGTHLDMILDDQCRFTLSFGDDPEFVIDVTFTVGSEPHGVHVFHLVNHGSSKLETHLQTHDVSQMLKFLHWAVEQGVNLSDPSHLQKVTERIQLVLDSSSETWKMWRSLYDEFRSACVDPNPDSLPSVELSEEFLSNILPNYFKNGYCGEDLGPISLCHECSILTKAESICSDCKQICCSNCMDIDLSVCSMCASLRRKFSVQVMEVDGPGDRLWTSVISSMVDYSEEQKKEIIMKYCQLVNFELPDDSQGENSLVLARCLDKQREIYKFGGFPESERTGDFLSCFHCPVVFLSEKEQYTGTERIELKLDLMWENLELNSFTQSGMGEGFYSETSIFARPPEIPELLHQIEKSPEWIARCDELNREANILDYLRHPNIITLIGIARSPQSKVPYLVTESVESSLRDVIKTYPSGIPWHECRSYCIQILRGLSFIHQKNFRALPLVPDSVGIFPGGTLKLTKFVKHDLDLERISILEKSEECAPYLAPEVTFRKCDKSVDIFSFGVMFTEMITRSPINSESQLDQKMKKIKSKLPSTMHFEELQALISNCISKSPNQRPSSYTLFQFFVSSDEFLQ